MPALSPRDSARLIAENSGDVSIVPEGVTSTAKQIYQMMEKKPDLLALDRWKQHALNPKTEDSAALEWVFVSDVMNFSFWMEEDRKFMVRWEDQDWTGYLSLCAAINRALKEGIPFTSASYYSQITRAQLDHVLRSDSPYDMPLIDDRLRVLHEAGSVLLQKYGGQYSQMVATCGQSAQRLVDMLVTEIPSFRDVGHFHGKQVSFYKRAQILVADTWAACGGRGLGLFTDIDSLTMFADYRIPQALLWFGVLKYSDSLMELLAKDTMLENGDQLEVEIRGCSIWAVELLKIELDKLVADNPTLSAKVKVNAVTLDHFLWDMRREHQAETRHVPYHKVRCIYY